MWAMLVAGIGAIYLLMYNPFWVPGGDSELYIAVGRSWATGLRHTFNGQLVSISPPGWPLVLAAAMKIVANDLKRLGVVDRVFTRIGASDNGRAAGDLG
jgi:hypothetical protein